MTEQHLTKPEKLLLTADSLTTLGRTPFDVFALTVASWERYPETFGLHGFKRKHPDNNTVVSSVVGRKGMAGERGWLRKVKENVYEITPLGRELAQALRDGTGKAFRKNGLAVQSRTLTGVRSSAEVAEVLIDRLGKSAAATKYRSHVTFADACEFFGDSRQVESVQEKLTEIGESEAECSGEARALRSLAEHLVTRFSHHFKLMANREKGKSWSQPSC